MIFTPVELLTRICFGKGLSMVRKMPFHRNLGDGGPGYVFQETCLPLGSLNYFTSPLAQPFLLSITSFWFQIRVWRVNGGLI